MINLALQSLFVHTCKWFFTCHKILRHGADSFTSPPKEGMLRIFMTLKNPAPWLGLNPWTSSPMESMLTIAPSWWLTIALLSVYWISQIDCFCFYPLSVVEHAILHRRFEPFLLWSEPDMFHLNAFSIVPVISYHYSDLELASPLSWKLFGPCLFLFCVWFIHSTTCLVNFTPGMWLKVPYGKAVLLHAMEALGGRGYIAPTHSRSWH
jgi:hypothetical protein